MILGEFLMILLCISESSKLGQKINSDSNFL